MASQRDLETVRRTYDAFNRRDIGAMVETFHPDIEWHPLLADLGGGVYRGREGVRRMVAEIDETWESLQVDVEDVVDAGELVFVISRSHGRGRVSGVETTVDLVTVIEMRDGLAVRCRLFDSLEKALAAAGLERLPAAAAEGRVD